MSDWSSECAFRFQSQRLIVSIRIAKKEELRLPHVDVWFFWEKYEFCGAQMQFYDTWGQPYISVPLQGTDGSDRKTNWMGSKDVKLEWRMYFRPIFCIPVGFCACYVKQRPERSIDQSQGWTFLNWCWSLHPPKQLFDDFCGCRYLSSFLPQDKPVPGLESGSKRFWDSREEDNHQFHCYKHKHVFPS